MSDPAEPRAAGKGIAKSPRSSLGVPLNGATRAVEPFMLFLLGTHPFLRALIQCITAPCRMDPPRQSTSSHVALQLGLQQATFTLCKAGSFWAAGVWYNGPLVMSLLLRLFHSQGHPLV